MTEASSSATEMDLLYVCCAVEQNHLRPSSHLQVPVYERRPSVIECPPDTLAPSTSASEPEDSKGETRSCGLSLLTSLKRATRRLFPKWFEQEDDLMDSDCERELEEMIRSLSQSES